MTRRIGAAVTVFTLGGAFALAGAGSAVAADGDPGDHVSWAQAQFVSGTLGGTSLDTVASVEPAEAWNDGNDPTMTDKDPLAIKALDTAQVGTGDSVQVTTDGAQAGVLGQYASATADGHSFAAAGAVVDDGGVGVGQDASMPGANADVDLNGAMGGQFASTLDNLGLSITAIGAQAQADGANATGDYRLDGVVLHMSSPAISDLTEKVNTALDTVDNGIADSNGDMVADVNSLLQKISPSLNLLGGNATVTSSIDAGDLRSQVEDLLQSQYGTSGVTFDLESGDVAIDLAKIHGGDLNDLPVGTELLDSPVINSVLNSITGKVATIADQVVSKVSDSLNDATVGLHGNIDMDVAQSPLVQKVCQTVQQVIQVPTNVIQQVTVQVPVVDGVIAQVVNGVPVVNGIPVVGNLVGGTLGGIFGGAQHTVTWISQTVNKTVTQLVDKTVNDVVCHDNVTPLPSLKTSADIDLSGTVDDFVNGGDVDSDASIQVLGVPVQTFDLGLATDAIGNTLTDNLLGNDGAISDLTSALDTGLVQPAVDGLLDGDNAVSTALTDVLSVKANVQDLADGTFTQTALQVTALGGLGSGGAAGGLLGTARMAPGLAQINLAQASVGPNVTVVADPCVVNCGVGGVTTTPTGSTPQRLGALAMTGTSIALLVFMVLALLAAGAYLVRESYRRNHSTVPVE
jgi:hypothetical protein